MKYEGLCIGGPYDGEKRAYESHAMEVRLAEDGTDTHLGWYRYTPVTLRTSAWRWEKVSYEIFYRRVALALDNKLKELGAKL